MKISQPILAVLALTVVTALAGCSTPASPGVSGSASASPPVATPSQSAALPPNALFQITAEVSTPTGETGRLVETVMSPVTGTGTETSRMDAAQCQSTEWATRYPTPRWLTVAVSSTLTSGTAWPAAADGIVVSVDGVYAFPAASSGIRTYQAYCASGLIGVPATGTYLLPLDPTASVDSARSWGGWRYGFQWAADGAPASDAPFTVTACTLVRGPGAAASATVSAWDPATPESDDGYPSCLWGTLG